MAEFLLLDDNTSKLLLDDGVSRLLLDELVVSGSLAASESGSDTFASTGTVSPPVSGSMAATETGADTFAATGTSGAVTAIDQILLPIIARRRGRR